MKAKVKLLKNRYFNSFVLSFMTSDGNYFNMYGLVNTDNKLHHLEYQKALLLMDNNNVTEIDLPELYMKKIILYIFENHDTKMEPERFAITENQYIPRKLEKKLCVKYMILKQIINTLYNFFGYKFKQDYVINLKPKAKVLFSFYAINGKKTSDITNAKAFDNIDECNAFIEKKMNDTEINVINRSKKVVPSKRLKIIKLSE